MSSEGGHQGGHQGKEMESGGVGNWEVRTVWVGGDGVTAAAAPHHEEK